MMTTDLMSTAEILGGLVGALNSGRIRVIHPSRRYGVVRPCWTHAARSPYADRVTGW